MKHLLTLLCLVVGSLALSAADWPQFRGPDGQGHSSATDLPTEWDATKNVVWKQDIPGSGWSSPVVVEGKVYLTSAVVIDKSKDLSLRTLCLDASSGKILWNVETFRQAATGSPNIHGKNSHASPTPVVEGGRIYVHFGHQGTACLDPMGKILWSNRDLKYTHVHGNGGSPVLVDGLLVFSTDGASVREVIALDAKTGKVKWRTARSGKAAKNFSFTTPLVIEVAGKKQIISPASDMVAAYDPATGAEVWKVRYTGYSVIPRPVFGHGMLFLSTSYDSASVLAIKADGKGDVTDTHLLWSLKKGAPHTPSMLLVGEELYMVSDDGLGTCVDAKKGTVYWQERLGGNGYSASPIYADGKLWFLAEDGVGTVVKAGKTYERLARNPLGERTLASYAAIDGALFIRSKDRLYRIGK